MRSAAGASAALGGADTVFGTGAFDALDQPALAAEGTGIRLDVSWQIDRFVDPAVDPWAVGVIVPLGVGDRRLPALSVSHRRLQADGLPLAGDARLLVDLDHELTNLGMAWRADDGRWSVGATLHAVSKSGVSGFTLRTATVDTAFAAAGHDDLLFAGSVGGLVTSNALPFASGSLSLRGGAALRRVGEDVDVRAETITFGSGTSQVLTRRSALASAVAVGAGAHWWRPRLALRAAVDAAWPLYDEAPDHPILAAGVELAVADVVFLRAGVRDDELDTIMTFGAGLRAPLSRRWSVSLDVAREPGRADRSDPPDATVIGIRLTAPIPGTGDDDLDDLLDDLDDIDDWIDDLEPASSDTMTTPTSDQE
ncbi:MAG TPA: hypothetical protein VKA86_10745 [Candidatus Krumholzibacteria bacterium]|nr:hypothetical protein [Candidatus Krumholzibacteria bacterium]